MSINSDRNRTVRVSILSEETEEMDFEQRKEEKQGHRARFNTKVEEHELVAKNAKKAQEALEGGREHHVKAHAWLDSQRLDGVAPEMSIDAADYPVEFENAQRDQELEYKLRHGLINSPKFNPKPGGP